MPSRHLRIQKAAEHNLREVNLSIPRDALVTFCGVSGSGKSSLVFDTIFQEGQRRFLESLSAYARQFVGKMHRPQVEHIEGLSPTVAIDQKTTGRSRRSTVGTITGLMDLFRLLQARLGQPHCPECGLPISALAPQKIVEAILAEGEGRKNQDGRVQLLHLLAPVIAGRKGEHRGVLDNLRLKGFVRARINGEVTRLDEEIKLARYQAHTIEVVIDRLRPAEKYASRLAEAVELALAHGDRMVRTLWEDGSEETYNSRASCPGGHGSLPELEPRLFSFNSPQGACPECHGLGEIDAFTEDSLVGDGSLSLAEGALRCTTQYGALGCRGLKPEDFGKVADKYGFDLDQPWEELSARHRTIILFGAKDKDRRRTRPFRGVVEWLERCYRKGKNLSLKRLRESYTCPDCQGGRLRPEALAVTFREHSIKGLTDLTVARAQDFFQTLELSGAETEIGRDLLREIRSRLDFLMAVGVPYLQLSRRSNTLSGGEAQRLRIAAQLGSGLCGVTYVLDEPSVGLHARDQTRLVESLLQLRDRGNSVLVVEHDETTMRASDLLVDIGPGPGNAGGRIVAQGTPAEVAADPTSPTGRFLAGTETIDSPPRRKVSTRASALKIRGASLNNLKGIDVRIPLGRLVCVTGVSGSGKTSLIQGTLKPALESLLNDRQYKAGPHEGIDGADQVDKLVVIDADPIGRTPRSNPATYTGAFTPIRELFALTAESRMRGYTKSRFSFNVPGGRCEACGGAGVRQLEMHFLPPVEVPCEECEGRRFTAETLAVSYKGKTILDVLEMEVATALEFFAPIPKVQRPLQALADVGLGYLKLGQTATTLSGGEAQRIKLAAELSTRSTGQTLYLLDEPTTGLHFADVRILLKALHRLVESGNSVLVIEHNLDLIRDADWLIDLGPEGGDGGGRVVGSGTPEKIMALAKSWTGRALSGKLTLSRRKRKTTTPKRSEESGKLQIRGARKHNLQDIDLDLPREKLVVVTGLSGSGKTSLAFDTIFAEGQRRFVESLSTYARRFLGQLEPAPVESITGIGPSIAVGRGSGSRNPRSTVATSTEIHDYLRLLYAKVGQAFCPDHNTELRLWTPSAMAREAIDRLADQSGWVTAPCPVSDADCREELRLTWLADGFVRCLLEGKEVRLESGPLPGKTRLELVIDRLKFSNRNRTRLAEAAEQAARAGGGRVVVVSREGERLAFTSTRACPECGLSLPYELNPRFFSFNHHEGACPDCHGLGIKLACDPERLIGNPELPLLAGGITHKGLRRLLWKGGWMWRLLRKSAKLKGIDLDLPCQDLTPKQRDWLLERSGRIGSGKRRSWPGLAGLVDIALAQSATEEGSGREELNSLLTTSPCTGCGGTRLNRMARSVRVGGLTLPDFLALKAGEAQSTSAALTLDKTSKLIAMEILGEIRSRLIFLVEVGLGYLGLDRAMHTLSGGEAQRIRLATQLGSRLTGVHYVLDEPTVGLHPRDTARLRETLLELRDLGNSVIVVEHDEEFIRRADHLVDLGPGAGRAGGKIVASGSPEMVAATAESVTGAYLRRDRSLPVPTNRRIGNGKFLHLRGAATHNLKEIDVPFPLGTFTVVTGVSGAGKSSLVMETLLPALRGETVAGSLSGDEWISRVQVVDARPIGRSPASNPATFTGIFTHIRELFSLTEQARMKGYTPGLFSPNIPGGRCEACKGKGYIKVEMHFLPDIWLECQVCRGRRFNPETLQVLYHSRNIAEVLEMEVTVAQEHFRSHKKIHRSLALLAEVGLGYLRLGQPAHTLSGGEAQRLRLAAELAGPGGGETLYILDEPTTGLHLDDIARLLGVLHRLVDVGGTVIVVEHHSGVVESADWVIDIGPEAAEEGGRVVMAGPPEVIARCTASATGRALGQSCFAGNGRKPKGGK